MGIIARQSSYNIVIILVGFALGAAARIFILPQCLEKEELGQIDILLSHAIMLSVFLNFGSAQSIVKFFSDFEARNRRPNLIGSLFIIPLVLTSLFGLLLLFFPELYANTIESTSRPFLIKFVPVLLLIVVSQVLFISLTGLSNSVLKSTTPMFLSEIFTRIGTIAIVLAYFYDKITFTELIWGYGIVYLTQCALLFVSTRGYVSFKWGLAKEERTQVLGYASYATLDHGASKLVARLDVLMIGALLPPEYAAFYLIAVFIATVIAIPSRAIVPIATPLLAKAWTEENRAELQDIYSKSSLNQMLIGGLIFIMIWSSIDQLLQFLPADYRGIKYVVLWLCLGNLLNVSFGINSNLLITSPKFRVNFYMNLVLVVLVFVLNLIFIPEFGIEGAAIATALALLIFNFLKLAYILVRWKMHPFLKEHTTAVIILGLCYLVGMYAPIIEGHFVLTLFVKSGAVALVGGLLILLTGVSPDIKALIAKIRAK